MRARLHTRLPVDLVERLEHLATERGWTKSEVIEAALASFFSPDAADRRDASFTRRLDRIHRQLEALARDQTIAIETLALFVRYYLSVTAALPKDQQGAARAQGKERFDSFVTSLGRRLARGKSLVRDLHEEIYPAAAEFVAADEGPAVNGTSVDEHAEP